MKSILTFKINKKKQAFFINKKLVNFIQKFSKKNNQIKILIKKIINNIDIPTEIIERINQILFLSLIIRKINLRIYKQIKYLKTY